MLWAAKIYSFAYTTVRESYETEEDKKDYCRKTQNAQFKMQ